MSYPNHLDISPLGEPLAMEVLLYDHGATELDRSYTLTNPYTVSAYRVEEDRIAIDDAVWGRCNIGAEPGDEVFLKLVGEVAVARLQGIEQLTLPRFMTTIAGTSAFSRWEHVWGSVILTRQLGEEAGIAPEELRELELRALLSDVGQWAFSHLGDWILQGMGGPEDEHDQRQAQFLRKVGIADVVEEYGYDLDDLLVQRQTEDWVECATPDLCVDRVDFGAREILRWLTGEPDLMQLKKRPFQVNEEGQMVMKSHDMAKLFAKAYMILPTEHWQEPVHRLQLLILQEMVKFAVVHSDAIMMQPFLGGGPYHPADTLMSVDSDFTASMQTIPSHQWLLREIAENIGKDKRNIFRTVRADEIHSFLRDREASHMPDPIAGTNAKSRYHPLLPSNVEVIPVEAPDEIGDFGTNRYTLDFVLPPLKPRWIDPLYLDDRGRTKRLSETDASFASLLQQQKKLMARTYVGRILLNPQYRELLQTAMAENQQHWLAMQDLPPMPDEVFKDTFEHASRFGIGTRLTRIDWQR